MLPHCTTSLRMRPDRQERKQALVAARRSGLILTEAAERVGVHVATVCRWQATDPEFRQAMRDAEQAAAVEKYAERPTQRPWVRWRNECPECRAKLVVRTANGRVPFWRCGRWPRCRWASWRPRHPNNCPTCKGPRFWSHSRLSASCQACKVRIMTP